MGRDSGKPGASEAASLVFRIATVGLSLASAITTFASTQCVHSDCAGAGTGTGTVSYSDFNSFKYSALADLLSAVLQGVAIYLEVVGKERAAKAVEFIDKLLLALTASSASLLLAVDDITSCGPPRGPASGRRQRSSLCSQASRFCGQVRLSSAFALAATVSVSSSIYTRHVPVRLRPPPPAGRFTTPRRRSPPEPSPTPPEPSPTPTPPEPSPTPPSPVSPIAPVCDNTTQPPTSDHCCTELAPPVMPPLYFGCPRPTTPCGCENPELCVASFYAEQH